MRNLDIRQGVLITAAAAALTLLALAPTAMAGTKSKSVTVSGNGAVGDVTAKCKGGQRATGGGFLTSPSTGTRAVVVIKSVKAGQKAWQVGAQLVDPGAPEAATITAYVYCDKDAPKTAAASNSATVSNTNLISSLTCPRGLRAKAGGFSLSPPVFTGAVVRASVSDSYRLSKSTWRTVFAIGTISSTGTSFAYCAKGSGGSRVGSSTGTTPVSALTTTCKKGVTAGGFSQSPFGRQLIYQSMRAGKAWRASGVELPPFVTSTLVARAYCL